jgi:hypothetical protein
MMKLRTGVGVVAALFLAVSLHGGEAHADEANQKGRPGAKDNRSGRYERSQRAEEDGDADKPLPRPDDRRSRRPDDRRRDINKTPPRPNDNRRDIDKTGPRPDDRRSARPNDKRRETAERPGARDGREGRTPPAAGGPPRFGPGPRVPARRAPRSGPDDRRGAAPPAQPQKKAKKPENKSGNARQPDRKPGGGRMQAWRGPRGRGDANRWQPRASRPNRPHWNPERGGGAAHPGHRRLRHADWRHHPAARHGFVGRRGPTFHEWGRHPDAHHRHHRDHGHASPSTHHGPERHYAPPRGWSERDARAVRRDVRFSRGNLPDHRPRSSTERRGR